MCVLRVNERDRLREKGVRNMVNASGMKLAQCPLVINFLRLLFVFVSFRIGCLSFLFNNFLTTKNSNAMVIN